MDQTDTIVINFFTEFIMKNAILFSVFSSFLMCNASHDIDCIKDRELQAQQVEKSTDQCEQNQIRIEKDPKGADCNFNNMSCFWGPREELGELIRDLTFLAIVLPVASYLITFPCDSSPTL